MNESGEDILEQMKENLAKRIDEENQDRWRAIRGIMFDACGDAEQMERAIGSEESMHKAFELCRMIKMLKPKERYDVLKWLAVAVLKNVPERSRGKIRADFVDHIERLT